MSQASWPAGTTTFDPRDDVNPLPPTAERDELLALMDNAGSGFALLELTRDMALEPPVVSGVATLLPLARSLYLLRDAQAPLRVPAGTLALVPAEMRIRLAAERRARHTARSEDHLLHHGRWLVSSPAPGEEPVLQVAAARIAGSGLAALRDVTLIDLSHCDITAPLLAQFIAEIEAGADGHAGYAMALFNACVIHALRRDRTAAPVGSNTGTAGYAPHAGIARAIAAIRAAPGDPHAIDALAALAGMSRSTFVRAFARATGSTAQRYLQQVRLDEAAALLGSSDLPIKSVAAMTGFQSRSHFSRAFREAFGADPTAYRRREERQPVPQRT